MNIICVHANPNILHTVYMLKDIQATDEAKIIQSIAGEKQRRMKRKCRHIENRLLQQKDRLRNDDITVLDFPDSAS